MERPLWLGSFRPQSEKRVTHSSAEDLQGTSRLSPGFVPRFLSPGSPRFHKGATDPADRNNICPAARARSNLDPENDDPAQAFPDAALVCD